MQRRNTELHRGENLIWRKSMEKEKKQREGKKNTEKEKKNKDRKKGVTVL